MKRAIVIVLDGCGVGEAPDAEAFGDLDGPSTIKHVWEHVGGFQAPNLASCGLLSAAQIPNSELVRMGLPLCDVSSFQNSKSQMTSRFSRLQPLSKGGKDSVTGHWEMMGIVLNKRFPTYPSGFPIPLIKAFESQIGTQTIGNRPASGTVIIQELGKLHVETGFPIVYTSADSVFQIACHTEVVPLPKLYEWCEIARELCVPPNGVQRVIARPFVGTKESGFTRTGDRRDYPMPPPPNLVDKIGDVFGIGVVPELFSHRGFREIRRTQNNAEHTELLQDAMESDARFVFANFEDTDMLFGHRSDPTGFANCLCNFDKTLGEIQGRMKREDILILTADHGNDPTDESTDHTREFVPGVVIGYSLTSAALGDIAGMASIGATVAAHLGLDWAEGTNLLGAENAQ